MRHPTTIAVASALFLFAACAARQPAPGNPAEPVPEVEPEPTLRLVEVRGLSDSLGTRLVAQFSRPPEKISTFQLEKPSRCVVDVDGPAVLSAKEVIATRDAQAPRLSVAGYADHVRLVLELGAAGTCQARPEGSAVVFAVGPKPSGGIQDVLWTAATPPAGASAHAAAVLASETGPAVATAPVPPPLAYVPPPPPRVPPRPEPIEPERGVRRERIEQPRPATAAAGSRTPSQRYAGRRVSLEFKDADILNVLRVIADVSQKNIVATDDVGGRVTIILHEVPWDQALDILLRSTGLEKVEYEDVITVSTSKRIEEERRSRLAAQIAGRELEPLRTEYIRVNYVKATDLAPILKGTTTGSAAGSIAAQQIQGDTTIQAEAAAGQIRGLLSNRGSVQVNEPTNTLIVRDVSEGIANARELAARLDVQTPQVAIQGLIFEADTSTELDLGIRWGAAYKAGPGTGNPTGRNFPGRIGIGGAGPNTNVDANGDRVPIMVDFPAGAVKPGSGSTLNLLLGSLSGAEAIDAQITALEQAGKGKVISRPKVITLNNSEASIESLEIIYVRLPPSGTSINTGQGGNAGGNGVATQAIDTGIILKVKPQVSSDGYVLMDLFVKSSVPSEQKTDEIPNEISRQATSRVLVREGETVVIGGVYRQRAANAMTGMPWLSKIPVLGWLFKTTRDFDNRQELLVFITPRVVWRPAAPGGLPSAEDLWRNRGASAYPEGADPEAAAYGSPSSPAAPRW